MVRNVAGTLIEVGLGRRAAESLPALLDARDRELAGPTAPARGLTLVRVEY
jgi:tRNA pseudouridine38-40 synthase